LLALWIYLWTHILNYIHNFWCQIMCLNFDLSKERFLVILFPLETLSAFDKTRLVLIPEICCQLPRDFIYNLLINNQPTISYSHLLEVWIEIYSTYHLSELRLYGGTFLNRSGKLGYDLARLILTWSGHSYSLSSLWVWQSQVSSNQVWKATFSSRILGVREEILLVCVRLGLQL